ncbi:pilus assembly protein [Pseudohalocynthiibacter sp. F2068]|jgi:hypothetical protein|uniref:TadE/TadG family type IV pilus assembly protein n=1 Tax=Pseudohalocynthiibacter sp. F2068 TaxID=2926418 RepID=UPI001FF57DBB|nr:pilus assembly protein [Pseudohalocynthiibacter sp. F2068]MCK0102950.1 pilus assembly protein [Pseudohalocynthiibacter sp. F2068]
MLKYIKSRLGHFLSETRASISIEAVIVLPMLAWAYVGMYLYFDAFRTQNTNLKAAYTLGDMLSRETDPINPDYLNGLQTVFDYLTNTGRPTWIRVTVVTWDNVDEEFDVNWSQATAGQPSWTDGTIADIEDQIPAMSNGDTAIIVETNMDYVPITGLVDDVQTSTMDFRQFALGIPAFTMHNLVITSPRFAPQLLWES